MTWSRRRMGSFDVNYHENLTRCFDSLDSCDSGSVAAPNLFYVFAFDEYERAGFQPQ